MRLAAVLLTVVMLASAQAPKQPSEENVVVFGGTGSDILRRCSDVGVLKAGETVAPLRLVEVSKHAGACEGYIAGVSDTILSYGSVITPKNRIYCPPPNAEMDQLIRVVKKWLEDNPSQLHLPAGVLVIRALGEAFPCG
jgi:hypothetical protein